jgi:menaquinone-specific isochorismate synthase
MESLRGDGATGPATDADITARSRRIDSVDHDAVVAAIDRPSVVWREPDTDILAVGATATLTARGTDRFSQVRAEARSLFDSLSTADVPRVARPRLFGGFAFYEREASADDAWTGFPDARFVLPAVQIFSPGEATWLTTTAPTAGEAERRLEEWADRIETATRPADAGPPGVTGKRRTPSKAVWREQVRDAVAAIGEERLRKVVLAQSLSVDLERPLSLADALARLDATYPDCYRFAVTPEAEDAGTFFGATPERLVSLYGRTVQTEALAGSTGRGDTPAEDEWLAEELLDSEKDNHEHDLVVEAIHDQLEPLAASVTDDERTVRRLATVQHLRTPIKAELDADSHVLSLVEELHPTPAVGGLPPDAALETIRETESFDRGWYAAPVGWFDAAGNGTFCVGIRSALASDGTASLFAGAGIVADSDPDREWDEVQLKYRPMLDQLE